MHKLAFAMSKDSFIEMCRQVCASRAYGSGPRVNDNMAIPSLGSGYKLPLWIIVDVQRTLYLARRVGR